MYKFEMGGLVMPLDVIRVLEDSAGDNNNDLQKNFGVANECGNNSCGPIFSLTFGTYFLSVCRK
jgi:hypothetical protein